MITHDEAGLEVLVQQVEAAARPMHGLDAAPSARVMVFRDHRRDGTAVWCAAFGFDPLCSLMFGMGATPGEALAELLTQVRESHRTLLGVAARHQVIETIQALARRYEAGSPAPR